MVTDPYGGSKLPGSNFQLLHHNMTKKTDLSMPSLQNTASEKLKRIACKVVNAPQLYTNKYL